MRVQLVVFHDYTLDAAMDRIIDVENWKVSHDGALSGGHLPLWEQRDRRSTFTSTEENLITLPTKTLRDFSVTN